jgi:hypothetical protein
MLRSAASKVMWVGRATVFLVGLAVILALVFGLVSKATAHDGFAGLFHLNHNNNATKVSTLTKSGAGPALSVRVDSGAPLRVNSDARVTNLNADKLDGNNSTAFLPSEIYSKSVTQTIPANNFDNGITVYCDRRDVAVSGSYRIEKPGAYLQVLGEERVDERFDEEQQVLNPSAWHVYVDNPDAENEGSITVFVHCADRPPLHTAPGP